MRKFRKKALVFAKETQYGMDAIDAGETATSVLGREMKIMPLAGENTALDYDNGVLGNSAEIATETYVTLEFGLDWAGSGEATTHAPYDNLLSACLRQSSTGSGQIERNIHDDSSDSVTFYFYLDGALHALTGARGNVKVEAKAKSFPTISFTFTGLFVAITAAAIPATNFAAWQTPLKVGAANTACMLDGRAAKLISFEYDQGNEVQYIEYVGHEEVIISDYAPSGKIVLEAASLTDFDPFAANTKILEFELTHGVAGNTISFSCNELQLGRAEYGDQDGILTYEIPIRPIGNSDLLITK
ncbi:phage tail tube protein [uncultured Shewanella sp.]|uniref:phage tail tube protein n=1 Tax=uncultured Shewanella sp. TaxID=173975 RepID=UPI00262C582D|nr:phage tail tube protein [uncultured Shewanella sp.]